MARVAIVIVTYQSAEFIGACLDSVAAIPDAEVVVVDNASADSTCVIVRGRGIRLIANDSNTGFAAAVNQGVRATSALLILLLNPDTQLETGLDALIARLDDPAVGAAGGLLVGTDGKPQMGFMARNLPSALALSYEALGINRLWPKNHVNWHYRCLDKHPMSPVLVEQPAGAFFLLRRRAWQELGGFDENFRPVWFEDVDFCARLKGAGYRVWYDPGARAVHAGGHSVGALPLGNREKYWYGSLLKYAAKHFHPIAFAGVCLSVMAGAAGRAMRAFPGSGPRAFTVYSAVIRLSFAHLLGAGRSGDRDV